MPLHLNDGARTIRQAFAGIWSMSVSNSTHGEALRSSREPHCQVRLAGDNAALPPISDRWSPSTAYPQLPIPVYARYWLVVPQVYV